MCDSKGLVTSTRGDMARMQAHKLPFCLDCEPIDSLQGIIEKCEPTALIGLAGLPGGAFTETMVKTVHEQCEKKNLRPIVMALSNPTSKSECTAEQAYGTPKGPFIYLLSYY